MESYTIEELIKLDNEFQEMVYKKWKQGIKINGHLLSNKTEQEFKQRLREERIDEILNSK